MTSPNKAGEKAPSDGVTIIGSPSLASLTFQGIFPPDCFRGVVSKIAALSVSERIRCWPTVCGEYTALFFTALRHKRMRLRR